MQEELGQGDESLRSNMNVQAHLSGQMSGGQVPNQGTMPPQSNGNSQMQNVVGASSAGAGPSRNIVGPMDHDILKLRQYMQTLV